MIPPFEDGELLPVGLHYCSWEEVEERFGRGEKRQTLCRRLLEFVEQARRCGFRKIIIWGSFVTSKSDPGDLDLLIVTRPGTERQLLPAECAELLVDDSAAKERFGHNLFNCPDDPVVLATLASGLAYDNRTNREKGTVVIEL